MYDSDAFSRIARTERPGKQCSARLYDAGSSKPPYTVPTPVAFAKRAASSTQMVSLATLQSLYSFRPGIAYVLDALYLAPTARSPARRTMRSCRGAAFATRSM